MQSEAMQSEFDAMLDAVTGNSAHIEPGWGQGRAAFGGLMAALAYRGLEKALAPEAPLRALSVAFVAPGIAGPAEVVAELLRQGRSASQSLCRIVQDGSVRTVLQASHGAGRQSALSVVPPLAAAQAAPEDGLLLPYIDGVTPEFTRHFEFVLSDRAAPFTGQGDGNSGGWVRFRQPPERLSVAHVIALIDAWPPAVLPMFKAPAPVSSMAWTMEWLPHAALSPVDGWWQYQASTDVAADGYAHIGARLFNAAGELVVLSRQTVALFG